MARVYWDTNLFIYLLEGEGALNHRTKEIRRGMLERGDRLYTGAITVGEVLVRPAMAGEDEVEQRYLEFFRSSAVEIVQFDLKAAPSYARIRLDRSIGPADAIQLACAAAAEVDMFITNDERLSRKRVPGIKIIVNLANAPLSLSRPVCECAQIGYSGQQETPTNKRPCLREQYKEAGAFVRTF